jgi:hypothetical protein
MQSRGMPCDRDEEALHDWIRTVGKAHARSDLEALGDEMIGRILASTLGRGTHTMPPPEVCNVFGEYGNNRMSAGFVIARITVSGSPRVAPTTVGTKSGSSHSVTPTSVLRAAPNGLGSRVRCASIADDLDRSARSMDEEAERRGFGV